MSEKMEKKIVMIAAIDLNRGIGFQGNLLYNIKADMKHFRDTTMGSPVIMGSKNYLSIPEKYRPLPGRPNIVMSRDPHFKVPGAIVVSSLEEAIENAKGETVYIIGGGQIYKLALEIADELDLTIIYNNSKADVFFPEYLDQFELSVEGEMLHDEKSNLDYQFNTYMRKDKP